LGLGVKHLKIIEFSTFRSRLYAKAFLLSGFLTSGVSLAQKVEKQETALTFKLNHLNLIM
jgi:hypothetical protein